MPQFCKPHLHLEGSVEKSVQTLKKERPSRLPGAQPLLPALLPETGHKSCSWASRVDCPRDSSNQDIFERSAAQLAREMTWHDLTWPYLADAIGATLWWGHFLHHEQIRQSVTCSNKSTAAIYRTRNYFHLFSTWEFVETPPAYSVSLPWSPMSIHEPFLAFTRKNDKRKKNDNVGYVVNDLCPDSWNPKFLVFPSFCGYLLLLVSSFHCLLS